MMRFKTISCSCVVILTGIGLGLIAGCNSEPKNPESDKFVSDMKQKFKDMQDPNSAVPKARAFAMEKLNAASNEELDLIQNGKPVIGNNYDGTQYSFTWKAPEGKKHIEVLTTPPPCEPIAVFRVDRVYYP